MNRSYACVRLSVLKSGHLWDVRCARPRLWEIVLRCSRPLCEAQDVVYTLVLKQNGCKAEPRDAHCVCFAWVLPRSFIKHVHIALVLWLSLLKPRCGAYHAGRVSLKPMSSSASEAKSSANLVCPRRALCESSVSPLRVLCE